MSVSDLRPAADRRADATSPRVAISNGFGRFHLTLAAAEADARGALAVLVTAAYPGQSKGLAAVARRLPAVARLVDRREPGLDATRIADLWSAELAYLLARQVFRSSPRMTEAATLAAVRRYCRQAARIVAEAEAEVFHFRSGFGGAAVETAARRDMALLCDHSIAHPTVLERLTAGEPAPAEGELPRSPFWRWVCDDLARCEHVLVNSDFVKSTFIQQGWDDSQVHVLYWGIDDRFLRSIPRRIEEVPKGPLRLTFAGAFGRRKGADVLTRALLALDDVDWELTLVGSIEPDAATRCAALLRDERVRVVGVAPRARLAEILSATEVFVFPSLAEGSARVVFEALAAGCYVVTTPNSGSIVEDGVHGALTAPGDDRALADALGCASVDRERIASVGLRNAELVRTHYRQADYGAGLARLYDTLRERETA